MTYSNEMINLEYVDDALEKLLSKLDLTDTVSASRLLTATDDCPDDTMEELFQRLEDMGVTIEVSDFPKLGASGQAALRLREEIQLVEKGNLIGGLVKGDPLRLYLEELASVPAAGDVRLLADELAQANRKGQDVSDVQIHLVNLSLSRVVEIAQEYVGYGVLLQDLIQEGSLGLWNGILSYTDGNFEAVRDWWIRQYMHRAILRQARSLDVVQKMRQAVEDYRMVDERLLAELGRNPTMEEIAEQLHVSVEETEAIRKTLENARMMGKAHAQPEPEEEQEEAEKAVEDTAYFQTRERVTDLLSGLTERESLLLNMRYGLDGKAPMTAAEAAQRLNMTPSEVVEMEAAALAKMRHTGE